MNKELMHSKLITFKLQALCNTKLLSQILQHINDMVGIELRYVEEESTQRSESFCIFL